MSFHMSKHMEISLCKVYKKFFIKRLSLCSMPIEKYPLAMLELYRGKGKGFHEIPDNLNRSG